MFKYLSPNLIFQKYKFCSPTIMPHKQQFQVLILIFHCLKANTIVKCHITLLKANPKAIQLPPLKNYKRDPK